MKKILFFALLFIGEIIIAQGDTNNVKLDCTCDTLLLYSKKASLPISKWKYKGRSFSYPTISRDTVVQQDSIYEFCTRKGLLKYIILFDEKNRKILEGGNGGWLFRGEIREYYINGQVKYISVFEDLYVDNVSICDGPCPNGLWKYYRRNGTLRKTENVDYLKQEVLTEYYDYKGIKKNRKKLSKLK